MCRAMSFSARARKENIFFDLEIAVKKQTCKNRNMVYRGLYSYWQRVHVITLFPNISYCFCMLSDFAKVFERNVWRVQVIHLHNAARALSSPSQCFRLSTNLGKDLFRYLWYCDKKKQVESGLAWHWWNSADLGLIDFVLINLNAEIVACKYHSENCVTSQIWKTLPNMVFPPIWGKKWRRSEHAHVSYPARPGSVPIWGGKKGEFRDWTNLLHVVHSRKVGKKTTTELHELLFANLTMCQLQLIFIC